MGCEKANTTRGYWGIFLKYWILWASLEHGWFPLSRYGNGGIDSLTPVPRHTTGIGHPTCSLGFPQVLYFAVFKTSSLTGIQFSSEMCIKIKWPWWLWQPGQDILTFWHIIQGPCLPLTWCFHLAKIHHLTFPSHRAAAARWCLAKEYLLFTGKW